MSSENSIAKYTKTPSSPYSIENELRVRKWLEDITGHQFEFRRNSDQCGYDIQNFYYDKVGSNKFQQRFNCFIEVEDTPIWVNGVYPRHWRSYSFLRRKVDEFDWDWNVFTESLKTDADKTIYLKVAGDMSDMCCAAITDIKKFGKLTRRGKKDFSNDYTAFVYEFPLDNSDGIVSRGVDECSDYIIQFINSHTTKP